MQQIILSPFQLLLALAIGKNLMVVATLLAPHHRLGSQPDKLVFRRAVIWWCQQAQKQIIFSSMQWSLAMLEVHILVCLELPTTYRKTRFTLYSVINHPIQIGVQTNQITLEEMKLVRSWLPEMMINGMMWSAGCPLILFAKSVFNDKKHPQTIWKLSLIVFRI